MNWDNHNNKLAKAVESRLLVHKSLTSRSNAENASCASGCREQAGEGGYQPGVLSTRRLGSFDSIILFLRHMYLYHLDLDFELRLVTKNPERTVTPTAFVIHKQASTPADPNAIAMIFMKELAQVPSYLLLPKDPPS